MLKANIWGVSLNIFCVSCLLLVRIFQKTRITNKWKKYIFRLIKNENKIVGNKLEIVFFIYN